MTQNETDLRIEGFAVRAPAMDDLAAVVDLSNAVALADTGTPETTLSERTTEWTLPEFNLATDARLVLAPDGRLAAYVELWDEAPHVRHVIRGRVHPDYRGRGLGGRLMDWAEARARRSLDKAPPEARVSLHTSASHHNEAAQVLFRSRGFEPARHFFRMLIEMAPGAPPP